MRQLRETFTDQEFADLEARKKTSGKTWHDFILYLASGRTIPELIKEINEEVREVEKK